MKKTDKRIKKLNSISPFYHRICHMTDSSNMTHDDILTDKVINFPLECYVQEKLDGANIGFSWYKNGPIVRNRNNILRKGYSKIRTNAKEQFKTTWNWVHDHRNDIIKISDMLMSEVTIYGEWMNYKHSIFYDKLPDVFIAYDIWVVEDNKFLSPKIFKSLISKTNIKYIDLNKQYFESISDVIKLSEIKSNYRNGFGEGIVLKTGEGRFQENVWKVVNKHFIRCDDFNTRDAIKNILIHEQK